MPAFNSPKYRGYFSTLYGIKSGEIIRIAHLWSYQSKPVMHFVMYLCTDYGLVRSTPSCTLHTTHKTTHVPCRRLTFHVN